MKSGMHIKLTVKNHCIKCAAQKAHENLINHYFKAFNNKEDLTGMELPIEQIKYFLEKTDFDYMRFVYPELSGVEETEAVLELSEDPRDMKLVFNGRTVSPKWRETTAPSISGGIQIKGINNQ